MILKANVNQGVLIPPSMLKEAGILSDFEYELSVKDNSIIINLLTDKEAKQLKAIDGLYGLLKDNADIIDDILEKRVNFSRDNI